MMRASLLLLLFRTELSAQSPRRVQIVSEANCSDGQMIDTDLSAGLLQQFSREKSIRSSISFTACSKTKRGGARAGNGRLRSWIA